MKKEMDPSERTTAEALPAGAEPARASFDRSSARWPSLLAAALALGMLAVSVDAGERPTCPDDPGLEPARRAEELARDGEPRDALRLLEEVEGLGEGCAAGCHDHSALAWLVLERPERALPHARAALEDGLCCETQYRQNALGVVLHRLYRKTGQGGLLTEAADAFRASVEVMDGMDGTSFLAEAVDPYLYNLRTVLAEAGRPEEAAAVDARLAGGPLEGPVFHPLLPVVGELSFARFGDGSVTVRLAEEEADAIGVPGSRVLRLLVDSTGQVARAHLLLTGEWYEIDTVGWPVWIEPARLDGEPVAAAVITLAQTSGDRLTIRPPDPP